MVIWIIIKYIIIVGAGKGTVRIFTKAATVILRIITWDMVMMIWITITFIILVRNSRIEIRIYNKVTAIIIFINARVIFMTKVINIVIIIGHIIGKSVIIIEECYALRLFR